MTELIYQIDSYLKEFSSEVTMVDGVNHGIVLDQTAFYPGGGGQPSDCGTIKFRNTIAQIQKIKRIEGNYFHFLEKESPLPEVGETITGKIDWDKRYKIMRTHSALHILCGVVFRDYGALVTGGNMEPLAGRMDFEFKTMQKELVNEIEISINKEVEANREIIVNILPREEAFQIPDLIRTKINLLPESVKEVRVIEIKGLDIQADGGTHVRRTSEVGRLVIPEYKSKGKINKRIYLEVQDL